MFCSIGEACQETIMVIGNRRKELRESKNLSQGDIEKRRGLLRCYISRVENGHTVPAIKRLEKMARALEAPMYRLFHAGEVPSGLSKLKPSKDDEFGSFSKLRTLLGKMEPDDQKLLLHIRLRSSAVASTPFRVLLPRRQVNIVTA